MDSTEKYRAFYEHKPCSPFYMKEFGFFSLEKWKKQGYIDDNTDLNELFGFDKQSEYIFEGLGWCEAAFEPFFDEKVTEDLGDKEVVRDTAGRKVLYYKDRREGYMPEYIDHPVKDIKTWEEDVKWRLNPDSPERYKNFSALTADTGFCGRHGKDGRKHNKYIEYERIQTADEDTGIFSSKGGYIEFYTMACGTFCAV